MVKDAAKKKAIRAIMAELGLNYQKAAKVNEQRQAEKKAKG